MTAPSTDNRITLGRPPALVVVDDHDSTRKNMASSLRRRFEPDYEVVESADPVAVIGELEKLREAGVEAAVIMVNERLSAESGTDFLARAHDVFPQARRLVLAEFGDNWVMQEIARASTLGVVDHFDYLPWGASDERFLAGIGDIVADWSAEHGRGDTRMTIVGKRGEPTFRILGEVLQRWQTYPMAMLVAGTAEGDAFLAEHKIDGPLPIVALSDGKVLTGATVAKVSDMVGAGADTESTIYDVAVVGLGPGGFSAALNAASEGLSVMMINDTFSQASSSPMIRNYLGFPAGVSGAELMRRAWTQALMFGAVARIGRSATGIRREGRRNVVALDDGSEVIADVVILANGVDYRRIGVDSVDRLIGRGVFYGFSAADAQAMSGVDAAVVGGANSACQAAVHLARYARSLHLIVRGPALAGGASEYLIEQLSALPNVTIHLDTEVSDAKGGHQLSQITLRDRVSGEVKDVPVEGLFVMIGALPHTDWLSADVARDDKGFVLTGDDGPRPQSPEQFRLPFETTMPGVFALGDVRSGSVKRVAAAVGEGSAAVQQVLRYKARHGSDAASERNLGEPLAAGLAR